MERKNEVIKVLIVEDHTLVCEGIKALLIQDKDIVVVGEAYDGIKAVELAEELTPDLVLMDLFLPNLNGVDATERIKNKNPKIKILILSMYDNEEYVLSSVRAGADGYILKGSGISELIHAIKSTYKINSYFSPEATRWLLQKEREDKYNKEKLTDREVEILKLVCEGYTSSQIANLLHISSKTVETHRSNITNKLKIYSVAELVRYAIKEGIILP